MIDIPFLFSINVPNASSNSTTFINKNRFIQECKEEQRSVFCHLPYLGFHFVCVFMNSFHVFVLIEAPPPATTIGVFSFLPHRWQCFIPIANPPSRLVLSFWWTFVFWYWYCWTCLLYVVLSNIGYIRLLLGFWFENGYIKLF